MVLIQVLDCLSHITSAELLPFVLYMSNINYFSRKRAKAKKNCL